LAAEHIQDCYRSRLAGKRAEEQARRRAKVREEELAATQIQAVARGRAARREVQKLREARESREESVAEPEQEEAAPATEAVVETGAAPVSEPVPEAPPGAEAVMESGPEEEEADGGVALARPAAESTDLIQDGESVEQPGPPTGRPEREDSFLALEREAQAEAEAEALGIAREAVAEEEQDDVLLQDSSQEEEQDDEREDEDEGAPPPVPEAVYESGEESLKAKQELMVAPEAEDSEDLWGDGTD